MAKAQGTNESFLLGFETAFKTMPGTPTGDKIPVVNPSFRPTRNRFTSNALTGTQEPRPSVYGKIGIDGDFGLECNPASLMPVCKGSLGVNVVSGLGPLWVQQYYLGAPLPMYAEQRFADVTQFHLLNGLYLGSFTWSFAAEGIMEARYSVMGAKRTASGATAITGAVTDRTGYSPFSYLLCRIKQGGVTLAVSQSVEFTVDRKLGKAIAQDQTSELAMIFNEIPEITGKIVAHFENADLLALGDSGAQTSLEIWVPGESGAGLLVEFPTIRFRPGAVVTNGTGLVTVEGEFDVEGLAGVSKFPGRVWSNYLTTATIPALDTLTLIISPNGGADQTVTFTATETTVDLIVAKINTATTLITASADRKAGDTGGVIRIASDLTGSAASIQVQAGSTADALLGFDNVLHAGLDGKSILVSIFSPLAA